MNKATDYTDCLFSLVPTVSVIIPSRPRPMLQPAYIEVSLQTHLNVRYTVFVDKIIAHVDWDEFVTLNNTRRIKNKTTG